MSFHVGLAHGFSFHRFNKIEFEMYFHQGPTANPFIKWYFCLWFGIFPSNAHQTFISPTTKIERQLMSTVHSKWPIVHKYIYDCWMAHSWMYTFRWRWDFLIVLLSARWESMLMAYHRNHQSAYEYSGMYLATWTATNTHSLLQIERKKISYTYGPAADS